MSCPAPQKYQGTLKELAIIWRGPLLVVGGLCATFALIVEHNRREMEENGKMYKAEANWLKLKRKDG